MVGMLLVIVQPIGGNRKKEKDCIDARCRDAVRSIVKRMRNGLPLQVHRRYRMWFCPRRGMELGSSHASKKAPKGFFDIQS